MLEDFLWVEKYRPRSISEVILPADLKKTFQTFVEQENIPNLLLTGRAGMGKTTIARAMVEELGCNYMIINGSLYGNIDTLRTEIVAFASSISLTGGRKYVILDEADYLNPNSTQPALRNFMEEYSKNCGFILTCNYKNRIIPELHSRCSIVEFKISQQDRPELASIFYKRVMDILKREGVDSDPKAVAEVVKKYFPDFRRVLNELQRYSALGKIDTGILSSFQDEKLKELTEMLKDKNFTGIRKWAGENLDIDGTTFFRKLYDTATAYLKPSSIPQMVLIIADYQYKAAFVADQEVNIVACLTELMVECEFK
jgi:DNA polymerase III delta prime subunit